MSEIENIREDIRSLRSEIRDLTTAVSKYMQSTESNIARLTTLSDQYGKQITEIWKHVNELDNRSNDLSNRIRSIEGASMGVGKLIALVAAVAGGIGAIGLDGNLDVAMCCECRGLGGNLLCQLPRRGEDEARRVDLAAALRVSD